jgi:hypothetical protein
MAKKPKIVPNLADSASGTFRAPPQQGQPLGKKDYGFWVEQGGTHFINRSVSMTKPQAIRDDRPPNPSRGTGDPLAGQKTHHEHRSQSWAKKR